MPVALPLGLLALLVALAGCGQTPPRSPSGSEPFGPGATSPEATRETAVYALMLVGTPYRNGGASPESGFDCSGFVWYVYRQATGVTLPRSVDAMSRIGYAVSGDDLRPGDLVFYNTLGRQYSHVGIYIGERRFVHAPSSGGQVEIVTMGNRYWSRRYSGARRIG